MFITWFPVVKVIVIGDNPLIVFAVAVLLALVVVHPRVGLKDAEAVGHQRGVADAGFNVLVVRELRHEPLVCMAERVADNVLWLQTLPHRGNQTLLKKLVAFRSNGGVIAVEIGDAAVVEGSKFLGTHHFDVLVRATLAAGVAVLNHRIALALHHLREAQGLAGKGAVAIGGGVLGVEDADEVETRLCHDTILLSV